LAIVTASVHLTRHVPGFTSFSGEASLADTLVAAGSVQTLSVIGTQVVVCLTFIDVLPTGDTFETGSTFAGKCSIGSMRCTVGAVLAGLRSTVIRLVTVLATPARSTLAFEGFQRVPENTLSTVRAGSRALTDVGLFYLTERGGEAQWTDTFDGGR